MKMHQRASACRKITNSKLQAAGYMEQRPLVHVAASHTDDFLNGGEMPRGRFDHRAR